MSKERAALPAGFLPIVFYSLFTLFFIYFRGYASLKVLKQKKSRGKHRRQALWQAAYNCITSGVPKIVTIFGKAKTLYRNRYYWYQQAPKITSRSEEQECCFAPVQLQRAPTMTTIFGLIC